MTDTPPETGTHIDESRMPLWEHLDDLRNCLIRSLLALFLGVCVTFNFSERIIHFLEAPLLRVLPVGNQKLYFTGITDKFMVYLKISIITAAALVSPFLLYQLWLFVSPALHKHEKRFFIPFAFFGSLSLVVGLCFAYYLVIPFGYKFLIEFGSPNDQAIITLTQYFDLTLKLMGAMGLIFELPVVMMLLARFGVVRAPTLRKFRRHAMLASAVLAAVITPTPDAFTMIIVMVPIFLLYEIGIMGVVWAQKKPEAAAAGEEE
jgi:sec-independent protein translocase protein TatC